MARTYVVTGSASGIGRATCELLASEGHRVIDIDLHDASIEADLATPAGREAMVAAVHEAVGPDVRRHEQLVRRQQQELRIVGQRSLLIELEAARVDLAILRHQRRTGLQRQVVIGEQRPTGFKGFIGKRIGRGQFVQPRQRFDGRQVERGFILSRSDQSSEQVIAEILADL